MSSEKTGVLLANLGSPTAPTTSAVRQFLRAFLGDPRVVNLPRFLWLPILHGVILPFRPRKSAKAYRKIWDDEKGSPLTFFTRQLTEKIAGRLAGQGVLVDYAMRYGEPSIARQLRRFKEQGVNHIVVLPLYPQYSSTTTASIYDDLVNELNQWRHVPRFEFISDYHQDSGYIAAVAQSIEQAWREQGRNEVLLMSFHGLPAQLTKWGDPYFYHCQKTAALIAGQLGLKETQWRLVFQSRFGKTEWLKPYCADTLQALPAQGVKTVDLVCPGFAVDCLETLEEIAMENKSLFIGAGGTDYRYIPALNDSDAQANALVRLLEQSV
ncbi:MAG: ferrochelatase [Methylovulum sp.]|nr:ferrochelatase [Methylovulum sp.]